jgi:hypothetical protein
MRAMSFYLADLALRVAERSERATREPVEAGPIWTPERAGAWRAWANREASAQRASTVAPRTGFPSRFEPPFRPAVLETARATRQTGRGGWLKAILGGHVTARG